MTEPGGLTDREAARALFAQKPGTLALYEALEERMSREFPHMTVRAAKTQVSFYNGRIFACASLPFGRRSGIPDVAIIASFSLAREAIHPRVFQSSQTSANRWTHHVIVSSVEDIGDELMNWMAEADSLPVPKKKDAPI